MVLLYFLEIDLVWKINEIHRPFQEEARREEAHWGFSFRQVSNLVIEQEIVPARYTAAKPYQDKLDEVRENMKQALITIVSKHNLSHLGIIQRQYKNYVGKPLPSN